LISYRCTPFYETNEKKYERIKTYFEINGRDQLMKPGDDYTESEERDLMIFQYQADFGDNKWAVPFPLDFIGTRNYDEWNKLRGLDQVTARKTYLAVAEAILKKAKKESYITDPKKDDIERIYNHCVK
jgi:acyl-CoA-binding protein